AGDEGGVVRVRAQGKGEGIGKADDLEGIGRCSVAREGEAEATPILGDGGDGVEGGKDIGELVIRSGSRLHEEAADIVVVQPEGDGLGAVDVAGVVGDGVGAANGKIVEQ